MARINKVGINYFSMDVDFFNDEKIEFTSAKFGVKGEIVAIRLLCKIYRNGYYSDWDFDEATLLSKRIGDGVSPTLVNEIVEELIKREFFNQDLFENHKILTSRGIQTRYFEATRRYKLVEIKEEFLLVDVSKYDNVNIIPINVNINSNNVDTGTQKKRKEKKEKGKEMEIRGKNIFSPPDIKILLEYLSEKNDANFSDEKLKIEAEKFINFYTSKNWYVGKNKMTNWKSAASGWMNRAKEFSIKNPDQKTNTSKVDSVINAFENLLKK